MGALGLGGVSTKTGLGTIVGRDRPTVEVDGGTWLLEKSLRADFALIGGWQAEYLGNLTSGSVPRVGPRRRIVDQALA